MNSRKNHVKRVAAGALAVLTVAAYAAPVANVGGLPSSILTADAAHVASERVTFNWEDTVYDNTNGSSYITGLKINKTSQTSLTSTTAQFIQSGSVVELTSSVPLHFQFDLTSAKIRDLTIAGSAKYAGYAYDKTKKLFTKENNPNMTADELAEALLEEAGYDIDTDETFTKLSAWNVANADAFTDGDYTTLTVNFYAKETVKDGNYTYTFVMPAHLDDDKTNTLRVSPIPQSADFYFYSSESNRTNKAANGDADPIYWDEAANKDGAAFGDGGYFYGLNIKSRKNAPVAPNEIIDGKASAGNQILGDTVTVSCPNPFVIHVNDNDDTVHWINPNTVYEDGNFKATFTMPKSKTGAPVRIDIVKIDEEFTYTASGSKLTASTKSGSIKNVDAAGIVAKYYETEADAATFGADNDKGKDIDGAVPNGKYVVIGLMTNGKLVTVGDDAVTIKKGSTILSTADDAEATGDELVKIAENKYLIKKNAGNYSVALKVTGKDKKVYEITYSFAIGAKTALTAENVKLGFTAKKDNVAATLTGVDGIMADGQNFTNMTVKAGQTATYMIASGKAAEVKKAGYQFTVTPTLYNEGDEKLQEKDDDHLTNYDYYVEGVVSGSTLGKTYTYTIYIVNPEYGGSETKPKTITMNWEVVDYDEVPQWHDNLWNDDRLDAKGSIEDLEGLEAEINRAAGANDAAKEAVENGEVRYQWIEGSGAVRTNELQDELDEWNDGLPTKMGKYTVYIIYKDIVKATVNVDISEYTLNIFANSADLTYTYGQKFELKKATTQKNAKGSKVSVKVSDVTCTIYAVKKTTDGEPLMAETTDEAWDGVDANSIAHAPAATYEGPVENAPQLPAGLYVVSFGGTSSNEKYSVVQNKVQLLTVNKKKIDDKSLVILIDPFTYDGKQHDVVTSGKFVVRDTDFDTKDGRYDVSAKFKMVEGGKQTKAGTYDCSFKLVSTDSNYEGDTVTANWYITHKEAEPAKVDAGLKWNDEKSTIYDNGRIHVEITRNADDKINKDNSVAKIAKFGVLFDKTGKLAAPAAYGVDYDGIADITEAMYKSGKHDDESPITDAEKEKYLVTNMLEYGNKAFGEGGYTKTTSPTCAEQTYKANIEVTDVETGMWLRPYVLYEDGTVSYGEIKYLDLTHEAIAKLQLQMAELGEDGKATRKADLTAAQTKTLKKTMQYVKTGYNVTENKFYAYTSYIDLETAGFTDVAQVADFGVVVDRNAAIIAPAANKTYATMSAEDKATVDKALRLNATKGLVVGHYKKDNPVLKENEYAASIKLGNAATGCWVRPYLDLGNGLVIYADPVYIKSASEYYGEAVAGVAETNWETEKRERLIIEQTIFANQRIADFAEKAGVDASKVEVVKTGVVADKNNKLKKPVVENTAGNGTKYYELDPNAAFNTSMVLGSGYIDGKKTENFGTEKYLGKISPKGTNDISYRTYTIFKVGDVEVTVYGPVKTYEYSAKAERVVASRTFDADYGTEDQVTEIGFYGEI